MSGALGHISKQLAHTQSAADALQARFDKIGKTFAGGMIQIGAGAALATPLILATKSAMTLESAMTRLKTQTQASDQQMKMLNDTFTKTANATGIFSKPKIASFAGEMFSMGIRDVNQINSLLPGFAKAADVVQLLSKGKQGASETVHSLVALAHQFGAYTPEKMKPITESAVALGLALPGGLKSLSSTGSSVNVIGRKLGIDPVQLMAFQAAVAQTSGSMGAGGKGLLSASNQANFIKRAMPGTLGAGLLTGSSGFAAAALGLADKYGASTVMKDGKLDFALYQSKFAAMEALSSKQIGARMLQQIDKLPDKKAADLMPLLQRSQQDGGSHVDKNQLLMKLLTFQFGSASTVALLAGDKNFRTQQASMTNKANEAVKTGGIDKMQAQVMKTLDAQLNRLHTNFETLSSTIGMQLIPVLTPMVTKFADFVDKMNTFAEANPQVVRVAAGLLAAASAFLIIAGVIGVVSAGFMAIQAVLPLLAPALLPLSIAIAAVTLAVGNWDRIMKFVNDNSAIFIHIAAVACTWIDAVSSALSGMIQWLGNVAGQIANFCGGPNSLLGDIGKNMAAALQKATYIDPSTRGAEEAALRKRGLGGFVDGVKGGVMPGVADHLLKMAAAAHHSPGGLVRQDGAIDFVKAQANKANAQHKGPTTINVHAPVTINAPAGTDAKALKKMIDNHHTKLFSDILFNHNASSGNSVGRSNMQGGATRP